jgi:hypothetical protein
MTTTLLAAEPLSELTQQYERACHSDNLIVTPTQMAHTLHEAIIALAAQCQAPTVQRSLFVLAVAAFVVE